MTETERECRNSWRDASLAHLIERINSVRLPSLAGVPAYLAAIEGLMLPSVTGREK